MTKLPTDTTALYNELANCYRLLGKYPEAYTSSMSALEKSKNQIDSTKTIENLGKIYVSEHSKSYGSLLRDADTTQDSTILYREFGHVYLNEREQHYAQMDRELYFWCGLTATLSIIAILWDILRRRKQKLPLNQNQNTK